MSDFSHLKNKLLAEQVEDQIYHYILDTPIEPGAKLPNEFALGEKFRVGRSTIREAADAGQKADVVFMDPPREGSTPAFLESVARMAPKRIIYVSCNPETMARDLALLTQKGYRAEGFTPVDMFPHSAHCEVVCALSRMTPEKKKQPRQ